jgi:hypothetical protein
MRYRADTADTLGIVWGVQWVVALHEDLEAAE